jgi:hypothetical protein
MPNFFRQPLSEFGRLEKTAAFSLETEPRGRVRPAFPGTPIYR